MSKRFSWGVLGLALVATLAWAGQHRHGERYYQARWCAAHHGRMEAVLIDGTRADCITATHAVEVDFAPKWAESIGQALFYAAMTAKRPGIVLIVGPGQERFAIRLRTVINRWHLPVDVWEVRE